MSEVEIVSASGERVIYKDAPRGVALLRWVQRRIGADCLDIVNLQDGRVMLVDDTGMLDGRPVNAEATKLYLGVCRPGTTHQIHGDVAVAYDADFE